MDSAEVQAPATLDCSICYNSNWEYLGVLPPCQHLYDNVAACSAPDRSPRTRFCFECIERWGTVRPQCPICLSTFVTIIKRRLDRSCLPSLCTQEVVDARNLPGEDVEHIAVDDLLLGDVHESLYEVLQEYFTVTGRTLLTPRRPDEGSSARSNDENSSVTGNHSTAPEPHPLHDLLPEPHPLFGGAPSRAYTVSAARPHVIPHATARTRRSWGTDDLARNPASPQERWRDLAHRVVLPDSPPSGRAPPPRPNPLVEGNLHDLRVALQDLRTLMQSWGADEALPPIGGGQHLRSSSDMTGASSLHSARMADALGRLEGLVGRPSVPYTPSGDSLDSMSDRSVYSMRAEMRSVSPPPPAWTAIPTILRASGGLLSPRHSLWALCGLRSPEVDAAGPVNPSMEERELVAMAARVFAHLSAGSAWPLGADWPMPMWLRSAALELQLQTESALAASHPPPVPPFMQPAVALLVHDMYLATLASPGLLTLSQLIRHAARGLRTPVAPPTGPAAYWLPPIAAAMCWESPAHDAPWPRCSWLDAGIRVHPRSTSPARLSRTASGEGLLAFRFGQARASAHPFAVPGPRGDTSPPALRRHHSVPAARRATVQGDDRSLSRAVSQLPGMQGGVVAVWDGRESSLSRRALALREGPNS